MWFPGQTEINANGSSIEFNASTRLFGRSGVFFPRKVHKSKSL